jgi:hypothetical protein
MSDHNSDLPNGERSSQQPASKNGSKAWDCQFCKDISRNKAPKKQQRPPIWWRMCIGQSETQKMLSKKLQSGPFHIIVVTMTLSSLTFMITGLALSSFYPTKEQTPAAAQTAQAVLSWISVGILSLFALEQLLKLVVFGLIYFINFLHALDIFIIVSSLTLEVVLRQKPAAREVSSLIIIFRLWRLVRIVHNITEQVSIKHRESLKKHHKLEKKMHERINELERQLQLPPSPPMTLNGKKNNTKTNNNTDDINHANKSSPLHDGDIV